MKRINHKKANLEKFNQTDNILNVIVYFPIPQHRI